MFVPSVQDSLYCHMDLCTSYASCNLNAPNINPNIALYKCWDKYFDNRWLCYCCSSVPILKRCVPEAVTDVIKSFVREIYALLNSWDFGEQVLSDIFSAWKSIAALTVFSLGKPWFTSSAVLLAGLAFILSRVSFWDTYKGCSIKRARYSNYGNCLLPFTHMRCNHKVRWLFEFCGLSTVDFLVFFLYLYTCPEHMFIISAVYHSLLVCERHKG